jgi:hypothetical protein
MAAPANFPNGQILRASSTWDNGAILTLGIDQPWKHDNKQGNKHQDKN